MEEREAWLETIERDWGEGLDLEYLAPTRAEDEDFREWLSAYFRYGASPRAAVALGRLNSDIDIRDILPAVHVPTLVLHRTGDRHVKVEETRYLGHQNQFPNHSILFLLHIIKKEYKKISMLVFFTVKN